VRDIELREEAGHRWRVRLAPRTPAIRVEATANDQLRWLSAIANGGSWEVAGERPGFLLDLGDLGKPLAAGWYELRGRLEVEDGSIELPSVRLQYVRHSALRDVEFLLPGPDASGRVGTLLLFIEAVESLEFLPSICPARFRMHGFSLSRVSQLDALRAMLGGPVATPWVERAKRLVAWAHLAKSRGLKRATDRLYADYRERMRPRGVSAYDLWVRKYDTIDSGSLDGFRQRARLLGNRGPLISVLLTVGDAPEPKLRHCLDSMLGQVWDRWELCVANSATSRAHRVAVVLDEYAARDSRVRVARDEHGGDTSGVRNVALGMARGEIMVLIDHEDVLRPHALLRMAEAAAADPDLAAVYSDDDKIDVEGKRFGPNFKPDWNPDLLRSRNYIGHPAAIRTALVREGGGFRVGFESEQDYDLLLRCIERVTSMQIRHIPEILCHRHVDDAQAASTREAGDRAASAGVRAVAEHLKRIGSAAAVVTGDLPPNLYRIRWPLPQPVPRVSLIVPSRDRASLLRTCVESILAKTTYPDFELVVVDNRSRDRAALEYLSELATRERVRVLRYDAPFNYSVINNWAARECTGELLGLVNNDIEVASPDWLEEMVGFAVRPEIGAVGAMLYYPDDTIQHAGMVLGIHGVAGHVYAGKPRGYRGYMARALLAQNLSAVTGACLIVRREVFDAVGGLDEKLPVEFNDVDFCLRVRDRGYRNAWTPFAELYHNESASREINGDSAKRARSGGVELMQQRWGDFLRDDPAYNPNLSLQSLDSGLAFPPRARLEELPMRRL
jgi:GT2 family glycosyltransferase